MTLIVKLVVCFIVAVVFPLMVVVAIEDGAKR